MQGKNWLVALTCCSLVVVCASVGRGSGCCACVCYVWATFDRPNERRTGCGSARSGTACVGVPGDSRGTGTRSIQHYHRPLDRSNQRSLAQKPPTYHPQSEGPATCHPCTWSIRHSTVGAPGQDAGRYWHALAWRVSGGRIGRRVAGTIEDATKTRRSSDRQARLGGRLLGHGRCQSQDLRRRTWLSRLFEQ